MKADKVEKDYRAACIAKLVLLPMLCLVAMKYRLFWWTVLAFAVKEAAVAPMRIRHARALGLQTGMMWHDVNATFDCSLIAVLLLLPTRPSALCVRLMHWVCVISQGVSLGGYMFYFFTRRKVDRAPRTHMSAIDWQTSIMAVLMSICVFYLPFTRLDSYMRGVLWYPIYVFVQFASIVGLVGIPGFFWGETVPRRWFNPEKFPFASFRWENEGRIYDKIAIQKWKDHTIDMSKLMSKAFPKQGHVQRDPAYLRKLVLEMCSAEFVHWILLLFSWVFAVLMEECGLLGTAAYAVGNVIPIMIQRYNRPRIMKILKRTEMRQCANS